MKKTIIALAGIAAVAAVSCSKEEISVKALSPMTFTAVNADLTKTSLDGVSIKWSAADEISVFSAADTYAANTKFSVESVSADGFTATYTGLAAAADAFIAAYPYSASLTAAADAVKGITIPAKQTAVAGGFADGANPAVAVAQNGSATLAFKNVGAIVGFKLEDSDVTSVILASDNAIAGTVDVAITDGVPVATVTKGANTIELSGSFAAGQTYYFVVAPGTLANPKITLVKKAEHAVLASTASKTVARNGNYNMGTLKADAGKWAKNGISTAADLVAFSAAVNSNASLATFTGEDGEINVLADIDMKGVEFTPIGQTTYSTSAYVPATATIFQGVFDGQDHTIDNLVVDLPASSVEGAGAALFCGAYASTIKNVKMGKGCVFTSETANFGMLASVVACSFNTTVTNCESYATVAYNGGTVDNKRQVIGGIVAHMGCSSATGKLNPEGAVTSNCTFFGTITSKNKANTKNGGTGISAGGIVGFIECTKDADGNYPNYNKVDNCVNKGTVSGEATRLGGIVASANNGTHITNCTNYATVSCTDKVAANSRVGGIVSCLNARTDVEGCTNFGTVEFPIEGNTTQGYAAGIVGQANDNTNYIKNCANYGIVRSDIFNNTDANARYIGVILGNPNSKTVAISGNKVGGIIAPVSDYDAKKIEITADNFASYITYVVGTRSSKIVLTDNTYGADPR